MIPTTGIPRLLIPLVVVTSVFGFLISMHVIGQGRKAMRGKLPWISNRSGFNVAMIICGVIYVGGIAYSLWQLLIRW